MSYTDKNKILAKITEEYPHFAPLVDAYIFQPLDDNLQYVMKSVKNNIDHIRVIPEDQTKRFAMKLATMKFAFQNLYKDDDKVGLYILPADKETRAGANNEHMFTYADIKKDLDKTLKRASSIGRLSLRTYTHNNIVYTVRFFNGVGVKHLEIKSSDPHGTFSFYKLMEIKRKLFGADAKLVAPIQNNTPDNVLHFYEWAGNVPNLEEMYKYTKTPEKIVPLNNIIKPVPILPDTSRD